jgi:mono/diheme cytochrome c family protein
VDAVLAEKGGRIFTSECADCHAEDGARVGRVTPLAELGVDPGYLRANTEGYLSTLKSIEFIARFIKYNAIEREKLHQEGVQPLGPATGSINEQHDEAMAFLKMKMGTLVRVIASFDNQTPAGPGRADSFGLIRNMLMIPAVVGGENFKPMTAPVSIPHLFGFGSFTNLHWDGNTTTGNDRNYAQAIALGANFDPKDLVSSVRPYELYKLEQTARNLVAPEWPAAVLGKLDGAKLERGEKVYQSAGCAGCHTTPGWHKLEVIGTDPNRIRDYNTPLNVHDGKTATYATNLYTSAIAVKEKAYAQHQVPPEEQKKMDAWHEGVTPAWITTSDLGYHIRPLRGVWATAPYLHNSSVPTLWDLLQPADKRPKTFAVGHREFDPQHVGFVSEPGKVGWTLDVAVSGNHNTGHEYVVQLSDEDKWALIEYLKTL